VNQILTEENDAMMFVTIFYGEYNSDTGELHYANGGHNSPLIVHADGSSEMLPLTQGVAIGLVPGVEFEQVSYVLQPGDTAIFYSDGVTEAMNDKDEEFGIERVQEMFTAEPPKNAEEATHRLFSAIRDFAGDTPQSDDITCITLRRL